MASAIETIHQPTEIGRRFKTLVNLYRKDNIASFPHELQEKLWIEAGLRHPSEQSIEHAIVKKDELPLLREAGKMDGIYIDVLETEGRDYMHTEGKEEEIKQVPDGHFYVDVYNFRRTKPDVNGFWNTFYALCEYNA